MNIRIALSMTIVLIAGLCGCATENESRRDAKALSIYVEKVKTDASAFSNSRDLVIKARTSTLNFLQASTLVNEQSIQRAVSARQVAQDKDWITTFESLKSVPDLAIQQRQEQRAKDAEGTAAMAKAKNAVDVKSTKLTEASVALAKLSEQPSKEDEAKFYLAFFKEVNSELAKKQENASAAATAAANASSLKTK
jgi:hypothetical protein